MSVMRFLLLGVLLTTFLLTASAAFARVVVNGKGTVVVKQGQVLSSSSGSSGSGSSGSGSSDSNGDADNDDEDPSPSPDPDDDVDQDKVGETIPLSSVPAVVLEAARAVVSGITFTKAEREQEGTQVEYELEGTVGSVKYKIKVSEVGKVLRVRTEERTRTETRSGEVRVRTRVEDGRTRIEAVEGGNKLRFEQRDGRTRLKVETEAGEEFELEEEDDEVTVKARDDEQEITIRSALNQTIIQRLRVQALTSLPISVNLETNELTVSTPAGERVVTVLPDQAVANMLAANTIDEVAGNQTAEELLRQADIEPLRHVVELKIHAQGPVYEVKGEKDVRFLGFWRLKVEKTVLVSAETGEIVGTQQTFLDRFFSALSISA